MRRTMGWALLVLASAACREPPARAPSRPEWRWVEGRVQREGKPVAGVEIAWQPFLPEGRQAAPESAMPPPAAPTDADGRFAGEMPKDATVFVGAGNRDGTAARVLQPAEPWNRVLLELRPEGRFKVRVVGEKGQPLQGAEVRVAHGVMEYQAAMRALFAASANALGGDAQSNLVAPPIGEGAEAQGPGVFVTKPLYAGIWHVLARAPGYVPGEKRVRLAHAATEDVELRLVSAAAVEGTVRIEGAPASGAQLTLTPLGPRPPPPEPRDPEERLYEAAFRGAFALRGIESRDAQVGKTRQDGRFTFDEGGPGECQLRAEARGAFPLEQKLRAPAKGIDVDLKRSVTLKVRVEDEEGVAIPAMLALEPEEGCWRRDAAELAAPRLVRGAAEIEGLAHCRHRLTVEARDCASEQKTVAPGEQQEVTVRLRCKARPPERSRLHGGDD